MSSLTCGISELKQMNKQRKKRQNTLKHRERVVPREAVVGGIWENCGIVMWYIQYC